MFNKKTTKKSGYSSINASFILIAFILVSALFATTFLNMSSGIIDQLTNTYNRAVDESKTALMLTGKPKYNYSQDPPTNKLSFSVRLFEETSTLIFDNNHTSFSISVNSENNSWSSSDLPIETGEDNETTYPIEIKTLIGEPWNKDPVLEGNEIFQITFFLNRIGEGKPPLHGGDKVTIKIITLKGAGLAFTRKVPLTYSPKNEEIVYLE